MNDRASGVFASFVVALFTAVLGASCGAQIGPGESDEGPSGEAAAAIGGWACKQQCWSQAAACGDAAGVALNACIPACHGDLACLDGCYLAFDAAHAQCDAAVPACFAACHGSCTDNVQNNGEAGVDCGGHCPNACPTCDDGLQNQGETGIDVGGPCDPEPNDCPAEAPQPGASCASDGACTYGQECCCGSCYPSFMCFCAGGTWACLYTDACFIPACP